MPRLFLSPTPLGNAYGERERLWTIMLFPGHDKLAARFWRAASREATLDRLDGAEDWPQRITRAEFELLQTTDTREELVKGKSLFARKRAGFLAANWLRFLIGCRISNIKGFEGHPHALWASYVKHHLFPKASVGTPLGDVLKGTSQGISVKESALKDPTLTQARRSYSRVAHFWAAFYDEDGTTTGLLDDWDLWDFICRAETYRRKAEELDLYPLMYQEGNKTPGKGGTHVEPFWVESRKPYPAYMNDDDDIEIHLLLERHPVRMLEYPDDPTVQFHGLSREIKDLVERYPHTSQSPNL